eukprot:359625-Chlamydomonas_euryale.AAC.2
MSGCAVGCVAACVAGRMPPAHEKLMCANGRMHAEVCGDDCMGGWMNYTCEWMDGRMDRWVGGRKDGYMMMGGLDA